MAAPGSGGNSEEIISETAIGVGGSGAGADTDFVKVEGYTRIGSKAGSLVVMVSLTDPEVGVTVIFCKVVKLTPAESPPFTV